MKKMLRLIPTLLVAIILLVTTSYPVLAIGNPASVTIPSAGVFRNVLTTGDQLWFARYNVNYAVAPSEASTDTWLMAIYGTNGTSLLYTRGLNYYQENIIAIYLTPAQALTWQAGYSIKIMGNPGIFSPLTEDINMQTWLLTPGDYYESSSLQGYLLTQATILQTDWAITLLTVGGRLNVTGSTYFTKAIPGLSSMLPEFFQVTSANINADNKSYTNAYATNTTQRRGNMNAAFASIGALFGVSEGWMMLWAVGVMDVILMSIIFATTHKPELAYVAGFGLTSVLGWIGLIDLQIVVLLVIFVSVLFAILFWVGRMA